MNVDRIKQKGNWEYINVLVSSYKQVGVHEWTVIMGSEEESMVVGTMKNQTRTLFNGKLLPNGNLIGIIKKTKTMASEMDAISQSIRMAGTKGLNKLILVN